MRQKPTCSICSKKFTRTGNMLRHMEDIHNMFLDTFKRNTAPPQGQRLNSNTTESNSPNSVNIVEKLTPLTPLERTWAWIGQVLKGSSEYMKSLNLLQDNNYLRGQLQFRDWEIRELRQHNLILPYSTFQGLSGYLCRRCSAFNFVYMQHIGYDKTMQSRHICDEENARTPKDASAMTFPELCETWDQYNSAACQILEELNFIMPGKKYLIAEDKSRSFNYLERLMHPDLAKILLGIPDRYCFKIISKEQTADWINRVVANMGKKTIVEDFEIRDFIRRVTSTYGIFEIRTEQGLKRILIKITK